MKKYIYELKEMDELFREKLVKIDPENNPILAAKLLTDVERNKLFQEIINEYGDRGWRLLSPIPFSSNQTLFFIFEKEVYGKKTE